MSSNEGNLTPESMPPGGETERMQSAYDLRVRNIADDVRDKRCILFLGSAIHAPSPAHSPYLYSETEAPPFGEQLSTLLADICTYTETDRHNNLPRVSWFYEVQSGFRSELIAEVRRLIQLEDAPPGVEPKVAGSEIIARKLRKPSPVLMGLARLGFPIVITTNYDQLYEQALDLVAQERARIAKASDEDVAATQAVYKKCVYTPKDSAETEDCDSKLEDSDPYLLKIHGDLDDSQSIVITDEDYIQFVLRMGDKEICNPVAHNVRYHLKTLPILFIGYRLYDYNLRLLFKTLRRQLGEADFPPSFAVDRAPDVLIRDMWDKRRGYIRFIEKDLWEFVPDLYKAVTGKVMPQ